MGFLEDDGVLMDRANLVRMTLRWLVLASVLLQATTPDLLDLSLLSQSLPPGPILAVSSLALRSTAGCLVQADSSPLDEWLRSAVRGDDVNPDDLCAPFWPEVGVMRKHSPRAEHRAESCLRGESLRAAFTARAPRWHTRSAMSALPEDLRCRLTC